MRRLGDSGCRVCGDAATHAGTSRTWTDLVGFVLFLGPHLWHMEVPRLGVQSELQPPACTTATATQEPSHFCDLHHSSGPRSILNPLSEARDRTRVLMVPSWVR